ncbi:MAG: hypothetical protein ABI167_11160 [Nitrosospira sp.]
MRKDLSSNREDGPAGIFFPANTGHGPASAPPESLVRFVLRSLVYLLFGALAFAFFFACILAFILALVTALGRFAAVFFLILNHGFLRECCTEIGTLAFCGNLHKKYVR